jgi:hypothetical protein
MQRYQIEERLSRFNREYFYHIGHPAEDYFERLPGNDLTVIFQCLHLSVTTGIRADRC